MNGWNTTIIKVHFHIRIDLDFTFTFVFTLDFIFDCTIIFFTFDFPDLFDLTADDGITLLSTVTLPPFDMLLFGDSDFFANELPPPPCEDVIDVSTIMHYRMNIQQVHNN